MYKSVENLKLMRLLMMLTSRLHEVLCTAHPHPLISAFAVPTDVCKQAKKGFCYDDKMNESPKGKFSKKNKKKVLQISVLFTFDL